MNTMHVCVSAVVFVQVICLIQVQAVVDPMKAVIGPDGSYNITILGNVWLRSAPTFFTIEGRRYSADNGSLILETINTTMSGEGPFGVLVSTDLHYNAGGVRIIASIVYYGTSMLTFKVRFVDGATNTSTPEGVTCGFPGFRIDSEQDLGFLSMRGRNLGFEKQSVGRWNHDADIEDGLEGSSPLILFDRKGNAVTFGLVDNFLSTAMWRDGVSNNVYWGTMGGVDYFPANFSYQLLASYSSWGISNSFQVYGFILLQMYYKLQTRPSDKAADKMGYWTDQGSYYYNNVDQSTNYEDILVRVFGDARNKSIQYSYVEWDTWWFTKGQSEGVKEWTAPSDIFPSGEIAVQKKLNVPVVAKNNFWSRDTVYAKENGGNYSFDIVGDMALPLDEKFWDFIFQTSKAWGLCTYIQDNMTEIYENFPKMKTDINYGRDWLLKMARSAYRHNITIQYSGALPRIAMEAAELPAVTQLRASPSFGSSTDQWKIGLTSMFGSQLSVDLFKDVFLTKSDRTVSPERESLVTTLSAGLLGIGDGIGNTNRSVINRACAGDGTILKPNLPAVAIDPQIREMAYQDGSGPDGEVWSTFSNVNKGGNSPQQEYGIIFVSGLNRKFNITPTNVGYNYEYPKSKIFSARNPRKQYDFSDSKPFTLPPCNTVDFCLYYTSPIIKLQGAEVLILGELSKWVPMSNKRVQNVTVMADFITISLKGKPDEQIQFSFSTGNELITVSTAIKEWGYGSVTYFQPQNPSPTTSIAVTTVPEVNIITCLVVFIVRYHADI